MFKCYDYKTNRYQPDNGHTLWQITEASNDLSYIPVKVNITKESGVASTGYERNVLLSQ